jgi:tRNA(Ile2) C34 agmatinyltransferase TiaS
MPDKKGGRGMERNFWGRDNEKCPRCGSKMVSQTENDEYLCDDCGYRWVED